MSNPAAGSRVRVYLASSFDGFIAGPGNDLSWLPDPSPDDTGDEGAVSFEAFISEVGALLMGRGTYDVLMGFNVDWPYGDRPVLIASTRALDEGAPATVRRVEGPIGEMVAEAKKAANGQDVYIDGGMLIRQACEAGLVDELIVFLVPVALGDGHPLFAGLGEAYAMDIVDFCRGPGGLLQIRLVPKRGGAAEKV
jgi:dihydrofolate reductase